MTHERCSELLRRYAGGELPPAIAGEVRAHLTACGECRAEERALSALAAIQSADPRPLDDMERARLHRGLAQELFTARANADVAGSAAPDRRRVRWIVPAATAVAVLAGVLVMTVGGGVNDSASDAALEPFSGGGGGDGAEPAQDSAASAEAGDEGKGKSGRHRAAPALSGQAGSAEADSDGPGRPLPTFEADGGEITTADLSGIGRGHLFRSFADAYRPDEGPGLYYRFLEALAREAAELGPQIEECAATLPQDGALVPAYATVGEYDGRRALVLGFVTSDPGSRRLDRYLMWVWELDECEQPIDTLFERIHPR